MSKLLKTRCSTDNQEANTCIALGATVGALGSASVVIGGALCPLCLVVAPGLVGLGLFKRWKSGSSCTNDATIQKCADVEEGNAR